MAKQDNRADNVEHLQKNIDYTISSLEEAEEYLDEHASELSPEDRERIMAKNERRRDSLDAFRSEIRDEAKDRGQ
ncbi:small acid-soluble spore protein Tlp [Paenibacillus gansuensis]|uniref:Small acid-soluble spore protein Tlp n=1 Tax=Paenibacillus gansuensis TaxID=306542 RepID=A0ABW5P8Q7_9BACL